MSEMTLIQRLRAGGKMNPSGSHPYEDILDEAADALGLAQEVLRQRTEEFQHESAMRIQVEKHVESLQNKWASRGLELEKSKDSRNAWRERCIERGNRIAELEAKGPPYAPPAIEVIDGVMKDKSQDADWLRARYFEGTARIEQLEKALTECSDRLESCIKTNGTEPDFAAQAVARYRQLIAGADK